MLGVDPVRILCDKLKGNSYLTRSHHSSLILNGAHESRGSSSLRDISANLDCIGLIIGKPEGTAGDETDDRQDEKDTPMPHKHIDGYSDAHHRENLGDGGYSEEAEGSIAANQVRALPPIGVIVHGVTQSVVVGR